MSNAESVKPAGPVVPPDTDVVDPEPASPLVKPDPFVRGLGDEPDPE